MTVERISRRKEIHDRDIWERVQKLRPLDDGFMRVIFRDNLPLAELVLRIITGIDDLVLTSQKTQYDMKRLTGARSVCLDVFGRDSRGRLYDLEIQRDNEGADPRRARYHSSAMDIEFLDRSAKFSELPVTYTIFVTENDLFGENKPLYRIERINTDTGKVFGDGEHIIYANASYDNKDDRSDIAMLMSDFRCSSGADMHFELMSQVTDYYKAKPKGEMGMSKLMEEIYEIDRKYQAEITAYKMIADGQIPFELISRYTDLTLDEIKEIEKEWQLDMAAQAKTEQPVGNRV